MSQHQEINKISNALHALTHVLLYAHMHRHVRCACQIRWSLRNCDTDDWLHSYMNFILFHNKSDTRPSLGAGNSIFNHVLISDTRTFYRTCRSKQFSSIARAEASTRANWSSCKILFRAWIANTALIMDYNKAVKFCSL